MYECMYNIEGNMLSEREFTFYSDKNKKNKDRQQNRNANKRFHCVNTCKIV